jgi:alkanesulfonate monooxygenase SsuD/methylene tetrahydromethanopterin reductase-like flavin-dependent oxidoreductase (luciferase family)
MRVGVAFNICNFPDWKRFLAMERGEEVTPEPEVHDGVILQEALGLAAEVEPLGYDSLWVFEMHGSPGLMSPDPTQLLSYYAGITKRVHFGSMITVLPFHNPIRLAEQISLLQHLLATTSRDRKYYLGIGRGLSLRNFEAMGINMDEAKDRFQEILDILQLAFTEEMFSYDGQHFQYKNVAVRPRPLDPSTVLEAWGSWTSEPSIRMMGARGLNPLTSTNKTVESYLADLALLDEVRIENGHGPAERPILQLPFYCHKDGELARERARKYFTDWVESIMWLYEMGTDRFATAKGYEQYRTQGSDMGDGTREDGVQLLTNKFMEVGLVGTPQECLEKAMWHHETMNPQEIVVVSGQGNQRGAEAGPSLRLLAEKVVPELQKVKVTPNAAIAA